MVCRYHFYNRSVIIPVYFVLTVNFNRVAVFFTYFFQLIFQGGWLFFRLLKDTYFSIAFFLIYRHAAVNRTGISLLHGNKEEHRQQSNDWECAFHENSPF